MTIVSPSPHGLQRSCICTVYKQTHRQLQAEMDSLCQFLFREKRSLDVWEYYFCIYQQESEEMGKEQRYWRNLFLLLERGQRPCCAVRLKNVLYPTTSVKDTHTSGGWTWTVIGSG